MATAKQSVKIFIASHYSAMSIAQKLDLELRQQALDLVSLHPVLWWTSLPGHYILKTIEGRSRQCDFAAVLFTKNDDEKKVLYNCILEAGFFSAGLGEVERCFALVACDPSELPSDLSGVIYIKLAQAKNHYHESESTIEEEESIKNAANQIGRAINDFAKKGKLRAIRGLKRPLVTRNELYNLERHKKEGGNLLGAGTVVFINTTTPFELEDDEFAARVVNNIVIHSINYKYVFQQNEINFTGMSAAIVNLIKAIKSSTSGQEFAKKLERVCQHLDIYFASIYSGFEFCIHNAMDPNNARCYMRCHPTSDDDEVVVLVEWCACGRAVDFAKLIAGIKDDKETLRNRIFHNSRVTHILEPNAGTPGSSDSRHKFTEDGKKLQEEICQQMRWSHLTLSDEEQNAVIEACFGTARAW